MPNRFFHSPFTIYERVIETRILNHSRNLPVPDQKKP